MPWPTSLIYPDDIDWRLFDSELTYRALALPNGVADAVNRVNFVAEVGSSDCDRQYLVTVSEHHAPLGIEAYNLTQEFRRMYRLPESVMGGQNHVEVLKAKAASFAERKNSKSFRENA